MAGQSAATPRSSHVSRAAPFPASQSAPTRQSHRPAWVYIKFLVQKFLFFCSTGGLQGCCGSQQNQS